MFTLSSAFALGIQALHLLPALVGLLLVLGIRTSRRWRTWALLAFGLGLLSGAASFGLTLLVYGGGYRAVGMTLYGLLQGLLNLVSLAAAGFGVAAVVADRRTEDADGAAPYPTSS